MKDQIGFEVSSRQTALSDRRRKEIEMKWRVIVGLLMAALVAGVAQAGDRCVEVAAGVLVCLNQAPDNDFSDGPDPVGLKTCTPEVIASGERCVIYKHRKLAATHLMEKRSTITDDIHPNDVRARKCRPYTDYQGDEWNDCTGPIMFGQGFITDDPDPTLLNCTGMECAITATRSCGISGFKMMVYTEDLVGGSTCIYSCPGEHLPHNTNCGGGAPSAPTCCGECPGGCVDPGTGQPLPWPCCPPPPDPDDVTK